MENRTDHIKEFLAHLQTTDEGAVKFDEEGILTAYGEKNDRASLAIKIVSILGGLLASLAFFGFLTMAGLYDSKIGLLVFGTLCVVGAIWINKAYHKVIIDTVSISTFAIGFAMMGIGLHHLIANGNIVLMIIIPMAFCAMMIARTYMISFLSILIINSCIITLLQLYNVYDLIHLYIAVLVLSLTYLFLKEAKLITAYKILLQLYGPLRAGLIYSFLTGLLLIGSNYLLPISPDYIWLSSLIIIPTIIYLISVLMGVLNIHHFRDKAIIYGISLLILLPTALSPAISGALLLILLSFMVGYRTGFVLGIIAFIYFIGQYYYNLNFTLLTKSILLFSSGIFFIALYLFTRKKLTVNEKI